MKTLYTLIIYLLTSSLALGCSCIPENFENKLQNSKSIYSGYFTSAEVLNKKSDLLNYTEIEAQLKVVEVFKGNKVQSLKVTTPLTSGACGMPITIGKKYLIVLSPDDSSNNVHVNLCTGSGQFPSYYEDELRKNIKHLETK